MTIAVFRYKTPCCVVDRYQRCREKHNTRCTYKATLWRVYVTLVAIGKAAMRSVSIVELHR